MSRQKCGGYSLLEMVFVMMAVAMVTAGLFAQSLTIYHRMALRQTMLRIETTLIQAKFIALEQHQRVTLMFEESNLVMAKSSEETRKIKYLGNVKLMQPQTLTFNEHGRISKAATMVFQSQMYEQSIVIWLAQGLYEISNIRLRDD